MGDGLSPPRGVTNQQKRSRAIAWMLAGLAAIVYVITVVKFDEQLDRAYAERRSGLTACAADALPPCARHPSEDPAPADPGAPSAVGSTSVSGGAVIIG